MVRCGMGMQQCAMHNAKIQKTTFFELGVYKWKKGATSNGYDSLNICGFNLIKKVKKADHLIKLENKPRNRPL